MTVVERETGTKTATDADVLERAADLLEEFGWCQGSYVARDRTSGEIRGFCMAGAFFQASTDLRGRWGWDGRTEDDLQALVDLDGRIVHRWNDEPYRTKAEVVAKLREAARLARQQEASV